MYCHALWMWVLVLTRQHLTFLVFRCRGTQPTVKAYWSAFTLQHGKYASQVPSINKVLIFLYLSKAPLMEIIFGRLSEKIWSLSIFLNEVINITFGFSLSGSSMPCCFVLFSPFANNEPYFGFMKQCALMDALRRELSETHYYICVRMLIRTFLITLYSVSFINMHTLLLFYYRSNYASL